MWRSATLFCVAVLLCADTALAVSDNNTDIPTSYKCLKVGLDADVGQKTLSVLSPVLKRMYEQAGHCVSFVVAPSFRITRMFIDGQLDAEFLRSAGSFPDFGNTMIAVPLPLFEVKFVLVWTDRINFDGQLKNVGGYSIGQLRSHRAIAPLLEKTSENRVVLNNLKRAIDLMNRARLDILAVDPLSASQIVGEWSDPNHKVKSLPYYEADIYHLIRKEHAGLEHKLAEAYRAMFRDGELDSFFKSPGLYAPAWTLDED